MKIRYFIYFDIILYTLLSYRLFSVEYEVSGVLYVDSLKRSFSSEFISCIKDDKWYLSYKYMNPSFCIANIESAYDGYLNYTLFHKFIPSNAFRNINITSNIVELSGVVDKSPFFHNSIYDGGDIIWIAFCSHNYLSSITNKMINPFFDKYGISSKTKIPATIKHNNNSIESFNYQYMNSFITYNVLEYTNINNITIPIKARAVNSTIYSNNTGQVVYSTGAVYYIEIKSITPKCLRSNFVPQINGTINCYDLRYDGHPYFPTNLIYSCSNWMSDYELTNSVFFKEELKRILNYKKEMSIYENRISKARIIFLLCIIITLIPLIVLFIRVKIRAKHTDTQ
ncbi:MAG: hypothetical protein N3A54_06465 [Patescibacteria group bacterium]|nr:hypothetical protein [Patescibacteria group bacterium]